MIGDFEYQNQVGNGGGGYGHQPQYGPTYGMQMQQPYQNMSQNGYSGPTMYPSGSYPHGTGYYSNQAMPQQVGGYGNDYYSPNPGASGGVRVMSTVTHMMGGGGAGSSSSHGRTGGMKMGEMVDMAKKGYEMYQKVQHPSTVVQETKHQKQFTSSPTMSYHNGDAMGWARNGRRSEWSSRGV